MGCDIDYKILDPSEREQFMHSMLVTEGMTPPAIKQCVASYTQQVRKKQSKAPAEDAEKLEKIIRFLDGIRQRVDTGKSLEDPDSCYCGLPLTAVREKMNAVRQTLVGLCDSVVERRNGEGLVASIGAQIRNKDLTPEQIELIKITELGKTMGHAFWELNGDKGCIDVISYVDTMRAEIADLMNNHHKIKGIIESTGLVTYDPAEAPFNPQGELVGSPQDIFDVDNLMVLASKFFEFSNLAASTGAGIEERTSMLYGKFPFIMVKKGTYVTRMSTGARRIMLLEFGSEHGSLDAAADDFADFITALKGLTPGVGHCKKHGNALTGYDNVKLGQKYGAPVCIHGLAEEMLPGMQYDFEAYR